MKKSMWKLHLVAFLFQMLLLSFEKIIKAFEKKKRKTIKTRFCYAHCTIFNNAFDFLCVYFGIFWFYYDFNLSSPVILTWFFNQLWIISKWSLVQCKKALLLTSQYCKHSLLTVYNIWCNFFSTGEHGYDLEYFRMYLLTCIYARLLVMYLIQWKPLSAKNTK